MKRELLIAEFLSTPWAVERSRLAVYARIVAGWHAGVPRAMEDDDYRERRSAWEVRRDSVKNLAGGGIMVLPVYGTIVQRAGFMTDWSGGTSTMNVASAFREAMNDPTVDGVLFDIDSPGGGVYGVQELADQIRAARGQKPMVAVSNSLSASAAYWIGCQADEFYCTPGGEVGSIGVWSAHEDWSKAMDEMGIKATLISAGKYKTEGNPYNPLDDEARGFMQKRVDEYYAAFTGAVAKGRGVPVASVRDGMGQGRVLGPQDAAAEKMIDGSATFEDAAKRLSRLIKDKAPPQQAKGRSVADARRRIEILGA